jgi:hypothetical protein
MKQDSYLILIVYLQQGTLSCTFSSFCVSLIFQLTNRDKGKKLKNSKKKRDVDNVTLFFFGRGVRVATLPVRRVYSHLCSSTMTWHEMFQTCIAFVKTLSSNYAIGNNCRWYWYGQWLASVIFTPPHLDNLIFPKAV